MRLAKPFTKSWLKEVTKALKNETFKVTPPKKIAKSKEELGVKTYGEFFNYQTYMALIGAN